MTSEPLPEHIRRPHLRPIQPVPVQKDGKAFVALRDPTMLSRQTMVVAPQVMPILQHFQGQLSIDELAERISGDARQLIELARGLDRMGLLWGPTHERMEGELKDRLEQRGVFPARASLALGADEDVCRSAIQDYLDQTENPEIDQAPHALVAPHLDYDRGWPNYAAAYHTLIDRPAPDRVVILGTNHFGLGDGVVLTEYGFQTPLGASPADTEIIDSMIEKLGKSLIIDQLDHLPEHSIELQLPWVQHCFGFVPVVAALVPDPLAPMIEDDGARIAVEPFIAALQETLEDGGGETFFIASADLSHVGPQFGEPRPVDDQRRLDVERHDRDMLAKFLSGDAEEFVAAMQWNRNPTRWCSVGNMTALLMLAGGETFELLDYRQACDDQGYAMVSSAAIAVV